MCAISQEYPYYLFSKSMGHTWDIIKNVPYVVAIEAWDKSELLPKVSFVAVGKQWCGYCDLACRI